MKSTLASLLILIFLLSLPYLTYWNSAVQAADSYYVDDQKHKERIETTGNVFL